MRIGLLTSSRADYGIYRPLLIALKADPFFDLAIIAFGTHLSSFYGRTMDRIIEDGFEVKYTISSMLLDDDPGSIATAAALTSLKFADFWNAHAAEFDVVFCLGDRYEMFAAVMSGIPFGVRFAHIHGGETTMGAIDNVYRHSITHASSLHFTSTDIYADRVKSLQGSDVSVVVAGSLSLDNLKDLQLLSQEAFMSQWNIDISKPYALITIHPETVNVHQNEKFIKEIQTVMENLLGRYQLVITLPNADTAGSLWRELFLSTQTHFKGKAYAIENFGTQSYFTCMQHSAFLLGNTSSGVIEAASFGKYAINVGDRQKGRIAGDNVIHVPFSSTAILNAVNKVEQLGDYKGNNPYFKSGAAQTIINALKSKNYK